MDSVVKTDKKMLLREEKNPRFCETRSKRSVEEYRGRNLDPPTPTGVTDIIMETVTNILATAHDRRDRRRSNDRSQT